MFVLVVAIWLQGGDAPDLRAYPYATETECGAKRDEVLSLTVKDMRDAGIAGVTAVCAQLHRTTELDG